MFPQGGGLGLREQLLARDGVRLLTRRRGLGAVAVAVALAIAAMIAIVASGGGSSVRGIANARAREPGATGVAAAYGYPTRCLSVTVSAIDRAFARADFDHANQCGRYAGYPTAIFHRANQEWEAVLEAVSYLCPVARIPLAVQRELGVCP